MEKHHLRETCLVPVQAALAAASVLAYAWLSPETALAQATRPNPRVSEIGGQTGQQNVVALIPFTVDDESAPLWTLRIRATSSNQALIPDDHITVQGTGQHRLLSLGPQRDQTGTTTISLLVENTAGGRNRQSFSLRIEPDPNRDAAVLMLSALVHPSPPQITLVWTDDPTAQSYSLYRRENPQEDWGKPLALFQGRHATFVDTRVRPGLKYEYKLSKLGGYQSTAYLQAGMNIPLVEARGTLVLIVDDTHAQDLTHELSRLEEDLIGEGWDVIRHAVPRGASAEQVKAWIQADAKADPGRVNTVFLFGHVPIAYSGIITAPDGHTTDQVAGCHKGAWPADVFYADLDGVWTDEKFADTLPENPTLYRLPNRNFVGDGKFDQDHIPSDVELQIGRVDLFNMTAFLPKTETDLLRQYLNRNHDYRHKKFEAARRAIVLDKYPGSGEDRRRRHGLLPSSRAFSTFFGSANVLAQDWFPAVGKQSFLCGYAGGTGNDTGINNWVGTAQFASANSRVVFVQLFGSYFGDWHTGNNFLRAPLAAGGYGLTSSWGGRPPWKYCYMALGETVGYCAKLSQNNDDDSGVNGATGLPFSRGIWIALMGDPTLRLHTVAPPQNINFKEADGMIHLRWTASADAVEGYHLYRAASPRGPFSRLTGSLIPATTFTDTNPLPDRATYMVRAVKLETSASGTYLNPSQGIFKTVPRSGVADAQPALPSVAPSADRTAYENPDKASAPAGRVNAYEKPTIFPATPPRVSASPGEPIFFKIHLQGGPTKIENHGILQYIIHPDDAGYVDIHRLPTPSTQWTGELTYDYSFRLPRDMIPGTYAIMYLLGTGPNREWLQPGPGVVADWQQRYRIGTLTVLPDTTPPSVKISNLKGQNLVGGQALAGKTTLRLEVQDQGALDKVALYFGQKQLLEITPDVAGSALNKTVDLDLSRLTNGPYLLRAVASDQSSNVQETAFQIMVSNPTVYPLSVETVAVQRGQPFDLVFNFSGGALADDYPISVFFKPPGTGKTIGPLKHQPVPPTSQWPGQRFSYVKSYAQFPIPGTFEVWVQVEDNKVPLIPGDPKVLFDQINQRYKVGTLTVQARPTPTNNRR